MLLQLIPWHRPKLLCLGSGALFLLVGTLGFGSDLHQFATLPRTEATVLGNATHKNGKATYYYPVIRYTDPQNQTSHQAESEDGRLHIEFKPNQIIHIAYDPAQPDRFLILEAFPNKNDLFGMGLGIVLIGAGTYMHRRAKIKATAAAEPLSATGTGSPIWDGMLSRLMQHANLATNGELQRRLHEEAARYQAEHPNGDGQPRSVNEIMKEMLSEPHKPQHTPKPQPMPTPNQGKQSEAL